MIRRALAAALVVAALGAPTPSRAQLRFVQGDGVHPLRTWCFSPTSDFCLTVTHYASALYGESGGSDVFDVGLSGFWWGNGFGAIDLDLATWSARQTQWEIDAPCSGGWTGLPGSTAGAHPVRSVLRFSNEPFDGGTSVSAGESQGTSSCARLAWFPTVDDFDYLELSYAPEVGGPRTVLSCDPSAGTCFSPVPEPVTWILLATGLMVVAFVSRRRRDEAA